MPDVAEGAQRGGERVPGRGDDQAVEQAAVSVIGPPCRAWCQGSAGRAGAAAAQAIRNARASMAKVTCRFQLVQVRTW